MWHVSKRILYMVCFVLMQHPVVHSFSFLPFSFSTPFSGFHFVGLHFQSMHLIHARVPQCPIQRATGQRSTRAKSSRWEVKSGSFLPSVRRAHTIVILIIVFCPSSSLSSFCPVWCLELESQRPFKSKKKKIKSAGQTGKIPFLKWNGSLAR